MSFKAHHKALGRCSQCNRAPAPNKTKCDHHLTKHRVYLAARALKEKAVKQ